MVNGGFRTEASVSELRLTEHTALPSTVYRQVERPSTAIFLFQNTIYFINIGFKTYK